MLTDAYETALSSFGGRVENARGKSDKRGRKSWIDTSLSLLFPCSLVIHSEARRLSTPRGETRKIPGLQFSEGKKAPSDLVMKKKEKGGSYYFDQ